MHATRTAGYSLYELLVTLAASAVVLGLGLPSFAGIAAEQRLRTQVDALFHAVHLARKVSITRRQVATLCPSLDGQSCSSGRDWSAGWILFVDADRDRPPHRDAGEPLLRQHRGDPRIRIRANRDTFTLRAIDLRATNGTLVFCARSGHGRNRALVISYTGRPRVAYTDRAGRAWSCPD